MNTRHFRTTTKEYCHINNDVVFIFNTKEPTRIPLEHELGNAWAVKSILNYIFFGIMLLYNMVSISFYGLNYFTNYWNFGALLLWYISFMKIREAVVSSNTPTIPRNKIKSVHLKTPMFSFPRVVIYFEGPEGKVLRRSISVKYKQEAIQVLKETGLME